MTNTTHLSPAAAKAIDIYATKAVRSGAQLSHKDARDDLLYSLNLVDFDEAVKALAAYGFLSEGATRMGPVLGQTYAEVQGVDWPVIRKLDHAR